MEAGIWIVERGDGVVQVCGASDPGLWLLPVIELNPHESYAGIPYQFWANHVGTHVSIDRLECDRDDYLATATEGATSQSIAVQSAVDSASTLLRVRQTTATLFVILACFGGLVIMTTSINTLSVLVFVIVPLELFITIAWSGVARRLLGNQVSPSSSTVAGWSNVVGGVALILSGIGVLAGGSLSGALLILFGLGVEEAGRGYLRLCIDRGDDDA